MQILNKLLKKNRERPANLSGQAFFYKHSENYDTSRCKYCIYTRKNYGKCTVSKAYDNMDD